MAIPSTLRLQIRQLYDDLAEAHHARLFAESRARRAFLAGLVTGGILAGLTGVAVGLGLGVRATRVAGPRPVTEEAV